VAALELQLLYTDALATCVLGHIADRATVLTATELQPRWCLNLEQYDDAIADCTKASEFNSHYMKALLGHQHPPLSIDPARTALSSKPAACHC